MVHISVPRLYFLPLILTTTVFSEHQQTRPDLAFKKLSIQHGLSHSTVFCVAQDRRGFIWIGTWDGLDRYHGYSFRTFRHSPLDSTSIIGNRIRCIYPSSDGSIWVGTPIGLSRYDEQTGKFTSYFGGRDTTTASGNRSIHTIYQDQNGIVWIETSQGLTRIERSSSGKILMQNYIHDHADKHSLGPGAVTAIFQDSRTTLWIAAGQTLCRLQDSANPSGRFLKYALPPSTTAPITSMCEDRRSNLWIGTNGGGVLVLDSLRESWSFFRHSPHDRTSLSGDRVQAILCDSKNRIWVGTLDAGLNQFNHNEHSFHHYRHDPSDPSSLSEDDIYDVFQRSGRPVDQTSTTTTAVLASAPCFPTLSCMSFNRTRPQTFCISKPTDLWAFLIF